MGSSCGRCDPALARRPVPAGEEGHSCITTPPGPDGIQGCSPLPRDPWPSEEQMFRAGLAPVTLMSSRPLLHGQGSCQRLPEEP